MMTERFLPAGSRTIGAGFRQIIAGIVNCLAAIGLIDDRGHKQFLDLSFGWNRRASH
jgi:hypothetical protein